MRIVIAGGGTGGHIYPGLAIAAAIGKLSPETEVIFVGSRLGLENKIIPRSGFPLYTLYAVKWVGVSLIEKISALLMSPWIFFHALFLFYKLRPDAVLGVGGFASGPFVFVSSFFTKTAIWEPNAMPGRTNRLLSRFVQRAFVVFDEAKLLLHCSQTVKIGLPVRAEIAAVKPKVPSDPPRLFVFGGSQGSRVINQTVIEMFKTYYKSFSHIKVVHQIGSTDWSTMQHYARGLEADIEVVEFVHDMDKKLGEADLVVCRAGASTIAELAATQTPAILIPLPTAADNHQYENAMTLKSACASILIEQKELTKERLRDEILAVLQNKEQLLLMQNNIQNFYQVSAADQMAALLVSEMEKIR